MLSKVPDGKAIGQAADRLLRKANAYDRWPTPVDDLVAAADLVEPEQSMLSNFVLEQAPTHLRGAIRKLKGRVRAVLDRKEREIHVDPTIQHEGRLAFLKLHEVSHDIFEWQKALGFADNDATLSPSIRKLFDWQANQGAAELLFQRERFKELAREYTTSMAAVLELASTVGSSAHAAFRRFVEVQDAAVAGVVMDVSPCQRNPVAYRRYEVLCSESWEQRFGGIGSWPIVLRDQPYAFVTAAEQARRAGGTTRGDFVLPDLRNEPVRLNAEVYCNQYRLLVLVWAPRREHLRRRRIIVPARASAGPLSH
jgi:hypothetical protein